MPGQLAGAPGLRREELAEPFPRARAAAGAEPDHQPVRPGGLGSGSRAAASATASAISRRSAIPSWGDLTLECDVLTVAGVDLRIVTYTAAPGTSDADQLDLLRASRLSEAR
ncbi:hypothetical protein GCM10010185_22650 [Saccharothrix coeruleofusca]|uniref:MmyB-like transcription regulator ligand binding domain-containing protein n=1 Tax=Saccharothrix coeruleofusca TaxID=33919 RepID=A0A918AJG1_9PSEU|nr:hypothetical protein GCM10010185_22650 [Saccharothrix coeruleofusca]